MLLKAIQQKPRPTKPFNILPAKGGAGKAAQYSPRKVAQTNTKVGSSKVVYNLTRSKADKPSSQSRCNPSHKGRGRQSRHQLSIAHGKLLPSRGFVNTFYEIGMQYRDSSSRHLILQVATCGFAAENALLLAVCQNCIPISHFLFYAAFKWGRKPRVGHFGVRKGVHALARKRGPKWI